VNNVDIKKTETISSHIGTELAPFQQCVLKSM